MPGCTIPRTAAQRRGSGTATLPAYSYGRQVRTTLANFADMGQVQFELDLDKGDDALACRECIRPKVARDNERSLCNKALP